jgi:MFS family permease
MRDVAETDSMNAPKPESDYMGTRVTSPMRRNLNLGIAEGIVAMPIVYLTLPGNFIVAMLLTQTFPLSESLYGLISSLPAWCNVIQLFLMPLLTRRWSQKRITLWFSWLHLGVWMALGIMLPFVPIDDLGGAGVLFLILFGLSAFFQSLVGVSWTSWIQEWVPEKIRGKYFGRRNRMLQFSTVAFLLVTGEALTRLTEISPVIGFQALVFVAVVLRAISIFSQNRILASAGRIETEGGLDLKAQMRLIGQRKPLLWLFGFGAAFGLTTGLFGPFFNVFLYDGLGLSVSEVGMLIVISSITGAISMPAWGQFLDRYGNRPTMNVALAMWMIPGFAWALLTPENTWILKLLFASGGIFSAGFILGQFNLLLKLVPPEAKTAAISMNVAITSLAAAFAPVVGGILLDHALSAGLDKLTVYHAMSVVHHALVLLAGLVLMKVAEPKSAPLSQVVGAMRSSRQVIALVGLSFLVNYVFTKTPKKAPDPLPRR